MAKSARSLHRFLYFRSTTTRPTLLYPRQTFRNGNCLIRLSMATIATYKVPKVENESNVCHTPEIP